MCLQRTGRENSMSILFCEQKKNKNKKRCLISKSTEPLTNNCSDEDITTGIDQLSKQYANLEIFGRVDRNSEKFANINIVEKFNNKKKSILESVEQYIKKIDSRMKQSHCQIKEITNKINHVLTVERQGKIK
eukprot:UN23324